MRKILAILFVVTISSACYAQVPISHPLGFSTLDHPPKNWDKVPDDYKLKGRVGEVLAYQDIKSITILREFMHIRDLKDIEQTIKDSIPPGQQFFTGALDSQHSITTTELALLTVLFEAKGDKGLLTIYGNVTVVEFEGRIGLILTS